jgi:3-oxoacyl-[acyl-carrier-protein] synthase-1
MTAVAITGAGLICGLGRGVDDLWPALRDGRSALRPITAADVAGGPHRVAAEVADYEPAALVADRKSRKLMRRSHVFGVYAGLRAVESAGFAAGRNAAEDAAAFNERSALYVGTSGGTFRDQYDFLPALARSGGRAEAFAAEVARSVHPMWLLQTLPNNVLCHLGIQTGFCGAHACIASHSTSGLLAVGEALGALREGLADRAVAVAHDAPIEPQMLQGLAAFGMLARAVVRPFDADRDGCLLGEGAAALALEPLAAARARGATVLGEVLGSGASAEALGVVELDAGGEGLARAMTAALADAGVAPDDVALIVAHGNATRASDASEAAAIAAVFGAAIPPVTATKWATGHLLAASGVLDALVALAALRAGAAPGIATLRRVDPACAGLPVAPRPQPLRGEMALVLSRGLAGTNAALVVRGARA